MSGQAETGHGSRPRRLGRGLSSLVDAGKPVRLVRRSRDQDAEPDQHVHIQWLSVARIDPSPYQPRRSFDEDGLAALADSIKQSGMMQPVVVRAGGEGRYELIAGERRWRASKIAGLDEVPALVRKASNEQAAELSLVENLQREDLNPVDRARAFRRLSDEFSLTHQQIGDRVGLGRSNVANTIRLLDLDDGTLGLIASKKLNAGHGKALLMIGDPVLRFRIAERAARESWTVRRTERAAAEPTRAEPGDSNPNTDQPDINNEIVDLEKRYSEHLGTRVRLKMSAGGVRGNLMIEFYDLDHFDGLVRRLGLPVESA